MNLFPKQNSLLPLLCLLLISCKECNTELIAEKKKQLKKIDRLLGSCQADLDSEQAIIDSLKKDISLQLELAIETKDSATLFQQQNLLPSLYNKFLHPDPDSLIKELEKLDPKKWELFGFTTGALIIWGRNKQGRIDSVQSTLFYYGSRVRRYTRKTEALNLDIKEHEQKLNACNQNKTHLQNEKESCRRELATLSD